jgi:hypothetical protein
MYYRSKQNVGVGWLVWRRDFVRKLCTKINAIYLHLGLHFRRNWYLASLVIFPQHFLRLSRRELGRHHL